MVLEIADSDLLPLTPLERIGPKGYVRYIFNYDLGNDYNLDEVANVLHAGLEATKKRIPSLNCEAYPDTETRQGGVLKVQRMAEGSFQDLIIRDLRNPGDFPMTYGELKQKSFPLSAFDPDIVCPSDVWFGPGFIMPVSIVQANFVPGGLILAWNILQIVGDTMTSFVWAKVWAEECRRAQGLPIDDPYDIDPAMVSDRQLLMEPTGKREGKHEDHPEYHILESGPKTVPPKMLSSDYRGQIFYFSPAALKALKAEAAPANAKDALGVSWISTNDALSALLWRTLLAVQHPVETLPGNPPSVFSIAMDGRQRTDPPIHPHTFGCFLTYIAPSAPVRTMLTEMNLADLSVLIRKTLTETDGTHTDDVNTLVETLDHVGNLVPTGYLDEPGPNCMLASWTGFELYSLDWGKALGGTIESVRCPSVGIINGMHMMLPKLPDGGMEVMMSVERSCLDKLLEDPVWSKFAKAI